MGTQQLCLKWKNHHNNIVASFEQLFTNGALVDMTLACEGHIMKAHKIVLSACSPFFQNLLLENPCQHPIIILNGMKYSDLRTIIDFMYHGEISVRQDQLNTLLQTAETLKVNGLTEIAQEECVTAEETIEGADNNELTASNLQVENKSTNQRKKKRRPACNNIQSINGEEQISPKVEPSTSPEVIDVTPDFVIETNSISSSLISDNCPQNQYTGLSVYNSTASYDITNSFSSAVTGSAELTSNTNGKISELHCVATECDAPNMELHNPSTLEQATAHQPLFPQSSLSSSSVTDCQVQQSVAPNMNNQIAGPSNFSPFSMTPDEHRKEVLVTNVYHSQVRTRSPLGLEESIKSLRCPYCRKVYSQSSSLKRHMEIHMLERKMYKCYICQKRFSWKNYLHLHLKRDHGINLHRN